MGTAGWAQAEADRARIRSVLRAPPGWRAPATTSVPASTTQHGAPIIQRKLIGGEANDPFEHEADRVADRVTRIQSLPAFPAPRLSGPIPAKLKIGDRDDPLEREADRAADAVMRVPGARVSIAAAPPPRIAGSVEAGADLETRVGQSKGRPLPDAVRAYMEPRFGADFSRIRVHTGSDAVEMNRDVGARAFTHGSDIYFGAGHRPANSELTAHELAHAVQQSSRPAWHIQRAPPDYTQPVTDVAKSGMTRLEVHGLTFGTSRDFARDEFTVTSKDKKETKYTSDEKNKTKESARHMAVVLVPDDLYKLEKDKVDTIDKPVQVLLHFHGWGFRKGDPYAGYRIGKDKGGTVRDVDQEHLEQQIGAFVKDKGFLTVGVLAQGVEMSDFGAIPTFEYIRDVLLKSKVPALAKVANDEKYCVVLSAHSGGGSTQVIPMLGRSEAETADRSRLASQTAGKDGRVVNKLQPVNLIVLFEALNGSGDVRAVTNWVRKQIDRLVPALKAAASPSDATARAELAATPKLRGYYGVRKTSAYVGLYRDLNENICKEIAAKVPEAWRADVADLFRIVPVNDPDPKRAQEVEHEAVISGIGTKPEVGTLGDALNASRDPTSDRARALACTPDAPETKKDEPKKKEPKKEEPKKEERK